MSEPNEKRIGVGGHIFVSPYFGEWSCTECDMRWMGAEPVEGQKLEPCRSENGGPGGAMKKTVTFEIDPERQTISYKSTGCGPAGAVAVGQDLLDVVAAGLYEVARLNGVDPDVMKGHIVRTVDRAFDFLAKDTPVPLDPPST